MNRQLLADSHLEAAQAELGLATSARAAGDLASQLDHLAQVFTNCLRAASYMGPEAETPTQEAHHVEHRDAGASGEGAGPKTRDPHAGGVP